MAALSNQLTFSAGRARVDDGDAHVKLVTERISTILSNLEHVSGAAGLVLVGLKRPLLVRSDTGGAVLPADFVGHVLAVESQAEFAVLQRTNGLVVFEDVLVVLASGTG